MNRRRVCSPVVVLVFHMGVVAFAQQFDTSGNAALRGDYFAREILITGQTPSGTIQSGSSAIGVLTFDGAGGYKFMSTAGRNSTGSYGVGSNGLLYIQSLIDGTQYAFGALSGVGPSAFIASATEGTSGDILVAIPAGSSTALSGGYTGGYIGFPNGDVTQVRAASLNFTASAAGAITNATVSGAALNLGGMATTQAITGASYMLAGEGSGTLNLGAQSASQILSGTFTCYLSADGNIFLAGTPGGLDLIVGSRAFSGPGSNGNWNQIYFTGGLEDAVSSGVHSIDAFYGSWNATGQGVAVAHERRQSLAQGQQVFDYTFDSHTSVQSNGMATAADVPYQFTLAAGGQVYFGAGTAGLYSLVIGFAAPKYSGGGVYLNPLGVVNAASFAPITNPIAPGEIVALFGSGLSSASVIASTLPLPTTLGSVRVKINGEYAPIFSVSPGQIAALVPQDVTPDNGIENASVQVIANGVASNSVTVFTNRTAPGVFSLSGSGIGPAAAELLNYSIVSAGNPATPGATVLLYATGLGEVSPAVTDGAPAPASPLAAAVDSPVDEVLIGEQMQTVSFIGLTPGLAGLFQLNTAVAAGTPSGTDFVDIVTPDAVASGATLAVGTAGGHIRSGIARRRVLRGNSPGGLPGRAPSGHPGRF